MTVAVLALTMDLHFTQAQSLKDKRGFLRPIIDGARHRFSVSVAETDYQDKWQRSEVVFVVVSGTVRLAEEQMDEIARFVWSFPEVGVLEERRQWMEMD